MRIGSLFSGYGGLDMAVEEVFGATTAWVSDIDRGACKILAHRYPTTPNLGDITSVDWATVEPVDIVTGGSPCQDLSHAGKRQGMTEGTRSNLWVAMREAIAQLRPRYVVWENVRGAYSAEADSELEFCAGCMGDPGLRGPVLHALGRVLGDLSDLGYDCRWHGLRAADVGAPHGRFRVFVVAADTQHAQLERVGQLPGLRRGHDSRPDVRVPGLRVGLLPTPRATDGTKGGPNQRGSSGDLMLPSAGASLLPTPTSSDYKGSTTTRRQEGMDRGQLDAVIEGRAVRLLPTPAVNDMGAGKTVEDWDDWTDDMKARHGNGNGHHGKSLAIEAQRLTTGMGTDEGLRDSGTGQGVRGVRDDVQPEALQRDVGEHESLPDAPILLAELREYEADSDQGCAALAGAEVQGFDLSGLRDDGAAARSPRGPQPSEQRPGELDDALRELSSQVALARGPRCPYGCGQACAGHSPVTWGDYEAAIRRWEVCLGRPAPAPTRLSAKGNPQLAADFCEWLMGLPAGWVTDVPGITRNEALKALGNGVVPQQATAALRTMLAWEMAS